MENGASFSNLDMMFISPNFRSFLRDQMVELSFNFNRTSVLIPKPYFSKLIYSNQFLTKKFLPIKNIMDIYENRELYKKKYDNIDFLFPTYFTLPVDYFRKKSYKIATSKAVNLLKEKDIKIDLIHSHRLDLNSFIGTSLKEIYGCPLVLNTHGSDTYDLPFRDNEFLNLTKIMLKTADHIIAVSRSDADNLISIGLDPRKVSIIPNGYNDALFRPISKDTSRNKLNLPISKKILLCVATLHDVKGHIYLIDAMEYASKYDKNLLLVLIGSGPLEPLLRKKIRDKNLDNIILVGWKDHSEIPLWMNASDFFILPSLNEGMPTVLPEVLACGKPVIATRVGGIPEIISNSDLGIIVEPMDSKSLADAILTAVSRKWNSKTILEESKKYSIKSTTKRIRGVYSSAIGI